MATKKKFKLKKKFKRLLVSLVLIVLLVFMGFNIYENLEYQKTNLYKFRSLGYADETIELLNDKLSSEHLEYLLNEEKFDYIGDLVGQKYYLDKNFDKYLTYYESNDEKSFYDVVAIINVGADEVWYSNTIINESNDMNILVNKVYGLSEEWTLGEIKTFSSTYAYGTVKAESACYDAFIQMAKSAKEDGITLILTSGYRTYKDQEKIYEQYKSKNGEEAADQYAARPGHSEHETGLALDILTYGALTDTFKETETYAWLHENSYKFGFIERYQTGKEYLTGYSPESWHYRYLGVDLATKVYNEGITYDEYYAFYLSN